MKKNLSRLLVLVAITASLLSCKGKTAEKDTSQVVEEKAPSNTVILAMGSGFSTLDPGYVYEQNPPLIINACYETLFKFVAGNDEPQPMLAESYSFSDDGLTLTIHLRKDATFASSNKVTSADVKFSLNRTKNLKGNPSFIMDSVDHIETPDEETVVIVLRTPDSAILSKLGYASCSILDSKIVKENGGTDAEDASSSDTAQSFLNETSAGSGMYILKSYIPDEEIVLEKNPAYWGKATNVDTYIIKLQDDANTQMMGLSSGDIDIALNLTDDTLSELEDNKDVTTINTSTKTVGFLMLNMDQAIGGPVANPLVQQAIKYAIDYQGMQLISGKGSLTPESFIQVGFMGSKGALDVTKARDLEKSKALLAEAGYADGFSVDLTVSELDMEGVPLLDLAQKVKDDLAAVNINVTLVQKDWGAGYGEAYRNGTLPMTVIYWGIDYNDPNVQLVFLPGQSVGLRAHWTADNHQDMTDLYHQILSETNNEKRSVLLDKAQDKMEENSPFIMLVQAASHIGFNAKLSGVQFSDTYRVDLTEVNVLQ